MYDAIAWPSRAPGWLRRLGTPLRSLVLLVLLAGISGCASLDPAAYMTDRLQIDKVPSSRADVVSVRVREDNGRTLVFGRLEKRYYGRGNAPGHLDIDLFRHDGARIAHACASYHALNPKQGSAEFARTIDANPAEVASVRVAHVVEGACDNEGNRGSRLAAPDAAADAFELVGTPGRRPVS
jgi:hypothetical protein